MQVAAELAAVAKSGAYDAVLCGKETINHNGGIVPGMLAEMLDLPLVTWATSLDYEDGKAVMQRDTVNGIEKVSVDGPYVLSASKGMSEQRIPNMRGIMGARSKPLDVVESCGAQATTSVASFALPPAKSGVKLVDADNPAELIRLLREEAKAI
jgi:electron transfer flavoprotein beta subunit